MLPHIHLGFLHIPTYSLMVFIGLIAFTVTTILLLEKREGVPQRVTNRLLVISIFGFLGLALFAFVLNSLFHSIEQKKIALGGITWLGGVLGAFPLMIFLIHRFCPLVKGEALQYFNMLLPGIVVAHGFGRIGCFLGGCCYGMVTDSIFGVSFPAGSAAANKYPAANGASLPVLPSQLFEAAFEFLLFLLMLLLWKKIKAHLLEIYAFSYGSFRFLLEFARGDDRGSTGLLLTPSQVMSLLLILGGILILLYHKGMILRKLHQKMDNYAKQPRDEFSECKSDTLRLIKRLKKLENKGIITKEEFADKKAELLKKI